MNHDDRVTAERVIRNEIDQLRSTTLPDIGQTPGSNHALNVMDRHAYVLAYNIVEALDD